MCGIIGVIAEKECRQAIINGLYRLEYRGYDSAGLALINQENQLLCTRVTGRIKQLDLASTKIEGNFGIGHTRWATHGSPTMQNAHPHISKDKVVLVHNGIIENYLELREKVIELGYVIASETDSEIIAHLLEHQWQKNNYRDLLLALYETKKQLQGNYSILAMGLSNSPGKIARELVCTRQGCALSISQTKHKRVFVASDVQAIIDEADMIAHLEDGDCAQISPEKIKIINAEAQPIERTFHYYKKGSAHVQLGENEYYMHKEITEQPSAIADTILHFCSYDKLNFPAIGKKSKSKLSGIKAVSLIGSGTSHHANLIGAAWIEKLANIPARAYTASEYANQPLNEKNHLIVCSSQSGETIDTLNALRSAKERNPKTTLGICNVHHCSLSRDVDLCMYTQAGPEISVASTKAFTSQLTVLYLLAVILGHNHGKIDQPLLEQHLKNLRHVPTIIHNTLDQEPEIEKWAKQVAQSKHAIFIARGLHVPIAMEAALKLKELSYMPAEGIAAGELKHGPLALIDRNLTTIGLIPNNNLANKMINNLNEVKARDGLIFSISGTEVPFTNGLIIADDGGHLLSPICYVVPLQLLAFHVAKHKKLDIDKPRNLAKSVTVE